MNLDNLNNALKKSWCKETCYEPMQKDWNKNNPSYGQCFVTALIIQDYFGGELLKTTIKKGLTHYWNLVDGKEIDLTRNQFEEKIETLKSIKIKREQFIENERYFVLKEKVENYLNN